ncbi:hypothetical protein ACTFIW_005435 [Dictyostelium discoideum]
MFDFLDRFTSVAAPQIRYFRGFFVKCDGQGIYTWLGRSTDLSRIKFFDITLGSLSIFFNLYQTSSIILLGGSSTSLSNLPESARIKEFHNESVISMFFY